MPKTWSLFLSSTGLETTGTYKDQTARMSNLEMLTRTRAEMEERVCMKNGGNTPWITP